MNKKQKALYEEFYSATDIDLQYVMENNGTRPDNIDELMEKLQELVYEVEVIYHSVAMEYLSENDPSLFYSMEIASDMGMDPKNLNSETLATLLKQQEIQEVVNGYRDELEEVLFDNDTN